MCVRSSLLSEWGGRSSLSLSLSLLVLYSLDSSSQYSTVLCGAVPLRWVCSGCVLSLSISRVWWGVREVACFLTCTLWLAFFVCLLGTCFLVAYTTLAFFAFLRASLYWYSCPLSLSTLSADSSSPLGRSSSWNLPLVPRGIIHHSFTVVFILHTPRSFFSLLLVIFYLLFDFIRVFLAS